MSEFPVTVADDGPMVTATVQLPGVPPERALAAFTDPALLSQWWGSELATTLVPGTPYTVTFRKIDRTMTGEVVEYAAGRQLRFTWGWAHERGTIPRTVLISVTPDAAKSGTTLTIVHGPHEDTPAALAGTVTAGPDIAAGETTREAESAARAGHREGWEFFLPRLAAALSTA